MEDLYFTADYVKICYKVVFLEDQLYYYIDTPGGIMNTLNNSRKLSPKYMTYPRGHIYVSEAVKDYKHLNMQQRALAAMAYQRVLRRLETEDREFAAEAQAYMRKNNHVLLRYRWGGVLVLSGLVLSISYSLWAYIFRRFAD